MRLEIPVGGRSLVLETGKLAKQAGGSVTAQLGDTVLLSTATRSACRVALHMALETSWVAAVCSVTASSIVRWAATTSPMTARMRATTAAVPETSTRTRSTTRRAFIGVTRTCLAVARAIGLSVGVKLVIAASPSGRP